MHSHVLQDFTTIRGAYNITVTQSENAWLDLEEYEDAIAWIDIREVTFATGSTQINFNLQTAPIKDEVLFTNMISGGYGVTGVPTGPVIQKFIMSLSSGTTFPYPLGRHLRWQLSPVGGTSGVWDMTFRVLLCANHIGASRSAQIRR